MMARQIRPQQRLAAGARSGRRASPVRVVRRRRRAPAAAGALGAAGNVDRRPGRLDRAGVSVRSAPGAPRCPPVVTPHRCTYPDHEHPSRSSPRDWPAANPSFWNRRPSAPHRSADHARPSTMDHTRVDTIGRGPPATAIAPRDYNAGGERRPVLLRVRNPFVYQGFGARSIRIKSTSVRCP
jgi:hypothetical protein